MTREPDRSSMDDDHVVQSVTHDIMNVFREQGSVIICTTIVLFGILFILTNCRSSGGATFYTRFFASLKTCPTCQTCPTHGDVNHTMSPTCSASPNWIYRMHRWTDRKSDYSQGAQDMYLNKIFSIIHPTNRYFVEFGFNEPSYESGGSGANTRRLYEQGWRGLLLDANFANPDINLKKHYLFASNIASIFAENRVPKELDYLSCDMDSHDLWVLRAILQAGYRPRVITTEFNANYDLSDALTLIDPTIVGHGSVPANFTFKFTECAWGASARALRFVAESFGYTLVGRVSALDLVWLQDDLVEECFRVPTFEWFFHDLETKMMLHRDQETPDVVLDQIVDYETFLRNGGDIRASNQAARAIIKQRQKRCFRRVVKFL